MILSVRCRNHFPVAQFQNQVHIRNPYGTGQILMKRAKSLWNGPQAPPDRGAGGAGNMGRPRCPKLFSSYFFTSAKGGGSCRPKYGAHMAPLLFRSVSQTGVPKAPLPRRARAFTKHPPKAGVSWVHIYFHYFKIFLKTSFTRLQFGISRSWNSLFSISIRLLK